MTSVLEVVVVEGRDLRAADITGTSDPYCYVFLSGERARKKTKVVSNTLNPVWDSDVFAFESLNGNPLTGAEILVIEVYDKDRVSRDDMLGSTIIRLENAESRWTERWYDLEMLGHKEKTLGQVKLRYRFVFVDDDNDSNNVYSKKGAVLLRRKGRWKKRYFVSFKDVPESLYVFKSEEKAEEVMEVFPDIDKVENIKFSIIDLSGDNKTFIGIDTCEPITSKRSTGSNSSGSEHAVTFLHRRRAASLSPPRHGKRQSFINLLKAACPYPKLFMQIITPSHTYNFCATTMAEATSWSRHLSEIVNKERLPFCDLALSVADSIVEESPVYSNPSTPAVPLEASGSEGSDAADKAVAEFFDEHPEDVEHLLEGTLTYEKGFIGRRYFAVLTPLYLFWSKARTFSRQDFEHEIDLSQIMGVVRGKREEDTFTVVTHPDALRVSKSSKLQKSFFGEEDWANSTNPEYTRYSFSTPQSGVRRTWIEKIEAASKQRQQNLHLWTAIEDMKSGHLAPDVIKYLKQGASAGPDNTKDGVLILHYILQQAMSESSIDDSGFLEVLKLIYEAYPGALTTKMPNSNKGYLPIHYVLACDNPNFKVVEFLLSTPKPVAVMRTQEDGDLPIHIACRYASPYAVKLLMDNSPCAVFINNNGQLPLHIVVSRIDTKLTDQDQENRVKVLQLLLAEPSATNAIASPDKFQATPLHLACKSQGVAVVKLLVNANQNALQANDHYLNRPFHYACERVQREKTVIALDVAAFVGSQFFCQSRNKSGQTPLDFITSRNLRERVERMIEQHLGKAAYGGGSAANVEAKTLPREPIVAPSTLVATPTKSTLLPASWIALCCGARKPYQQAKDINMFNSKAEEEVPQEEATLPRMASEEERLSIARSHKFVTQSGRIKALIRIDTGELVAQNQEELKETAGKVEEIASGTQEIQQQYEEIATLENNFGEAFNSLEDSVTGSLERVKDAHENIRIADEIGSTTGYISASGAKKKLETTAILSGAASSLSTVTSAASSLR